MRRREAEQAMIADPSGFALPANIPAPSWYAWLGMRLTNENAEPYVTYIRRLPRQMQAVIISTAVLRDPEITKSTPIREWFLDEGVRAFMGEKV